MGGRVACSETIALCGKYSTVGQLVTMNPRPGKNQQTVVDPGAFMHIDPAVLTEYGDLNGQPAWNTSEMRLVCSHSYISSLELAKEFTAGYGADSDLSHAARLVKCCRPYIPAGMPVRIFFLNSLRKVEGGFFGVLLEIGASGNYLRDHFLTGFAQDSWFAVC